MNRLTNDLISRTVLLKDLSYCAPELWQDEEYIKTKIMKQHAVDAVPVVHGRWIKYEPDMHGTEPLACNVCNYLFAQLYPQNYCPNCGAKMETKNEQSV